MDVITVYTVEFGGHDPLREPQSINSGVDYIYITDQPLTSSTWQMRVVSPSFPDSRRSSRFYFDQSCLTFPSSTYTIMHGANSSLTADPIALIDTYLITPNVDIAMFSHPHRDCIYDEAAAVIAMGKDTATNVNPQMDRYREEGFPTHFGLHACTLMLRRNTPSLLEFERQWWTEVSTGSFRDQLSFDYIRWKLNFPIGMIPGELFNSDIFDYRIHQV